MKQALTLALVLTALMLVSSTASADTFSFPKAQLEYTYSTDWTMERKDGKVKLIAPDKTLILLFSEIEGTEKIATEAVKKGLKATGCTTEVKSTGDPKNFNGIKTHAFVCEGKIKDTKTLNLAFLYTSPVSGKFVFAFLMELKKPKDDVKKSAITMLQKVKAIKK